jgi:hypothetical protein
MEKYSKWQPSLFPHPGAVEAHLVRRCGGFPRSHGDFVTVETHAGVDEAQTRATKPHFEKFLVLYKLCIRAVEAPSTAVEVLPVAEKVPSGAGESHSGARLQLLLESR